MADTGQDSRFADSSDEDLSDKQIQDLLKEAEARLRRNPISKSILLPPKRLTSKRSSAGTTTKIPSFKTEIGGPTPRLRRVDDPVVVKQEKAKAKKATAGPDWYNMPRTELTPGLKQDLQLLKMRNVLDPHRHYKKDNLRQAAPEYSQVGTIVEGPTDFYSARLNKSERFESFTDEVLAGEKTSGRFKSKYGEIQEKKTSGKRGFYKGLMAKRARSFKR